MSDPGVWLTEMIVEGRMADHRQAVESIARQIGSTVQPDGHGYVNRFEVPSSSGTKVYLVSQRQTDGTWCCSCRGWITHRRCKHLTDILSRLQEVARTATTGQRIAPSVASMLSSARTAYDLLGGVR